MALAVDNPPLYRVKFLRIPILETITLLALITHRVFPKDVTIPGFEGAHWIYFYLTGAIPLSIPISLLLNIVALNNFKWDIGIASVSAACLFFLRGWFSDPVLLGGFLLAFLQVLCTSGITRVWVRCTVRHRKSLWPERSVQPFRADLDSRLMYWHHIYQ